MSSAKDLRRAQAAYRKSVEGESASQTAVLDAPDWRSEPPPRPALLGPITVANRTYATRYSLAPLAGYTQLAFRRVIRERGGVGLCTTDLVQATQLAARGKWSELLIATTPDDKPLSVQIFGGILDHLVRAAKLLEDRGYQGIDINMGCPMAKVTGQGGGARLMCDSGGACNLVGQVVSAVKIPVTVKMRLGWDRENLTAPALARAFEDLGVTAITIHGRTRQQGFAGKVHLDGVRQVVEAVDQIPVIGNGDVRNVADAWRMRAITGCHGVAIGRGALLDPWIFHRIQIAESAMSGEEGLRQSVDFVPTRDEQVDFLKRHFELMSEQHGESKSCQMFRKFAAWYGARLGIPEDLEHRLRMFESLAEFYEIVERIRERHGERANPRATIEIKVPNGPNELW